MLPLSILLVLLVPWLAYVLYPPVLKSGDQVPRWAETELQAMGPLCSREKRMLGLMVGALVLWIFGGDYIDAAMVGYSVVALMLLLRIISWDALSVIKRRGTFSSGWPRLSPSPPDSTTPVLLAGLANC